jgi:hypothetical protein
MKKNKMKIKKFEELTFNFTDKDIKTIRDYLKDNFVESEEYSDVIMALNNIENRLDNISNDNLYNDDVDY